MGRYATLVVALGCLVGCKQVLGLDDFVPESSSAVGGGGAAGGGGGVGGGMPPGRCGGFAALADDFEDGSLLATADRPGWESTLDFATAVEEQGFMIVRLAPRFNSAFGQVHPRHRASLLGEAVTVRVARLTSTPTTVTRVWLDYDGNNHLAFEARPDAELRALTFINGTAEEIGAEPYDPEKHVYWRFEESGGQVSWRTSRDGSNWSDLLASVGTSTLPFNLGVLKLNMDAQSSSPNNDADEARFDELNDVMQVEPWCPATSFTDDFADALLGDGWFRTDLAGNSCTATEGNDELRLGWPGTNQVGCQYRSSTAFNLENSQVSVQVKHIDLAAEVTVFLRVYFDDGHFIDVRESTSGGVDQIRAMKYVDGEDQLASDTYDPQQHRWWRLREQGGTTYWETSPDGMVWNPLASEPNSMPPHVVDVALGVFVVPGAVPGEAVFSHYNLPP